MLNLYSVVMRDSGIEMEVLDEETRLGMMFEQFPKTKEIWEATSYKTFTLYDPTVFSHWTLGLVRERLAGGRIRYVREVTCNRCKKVTLASVLKVLCYYVGFKKKLCRHCDGSEIPGNRLLTTRHTGGTKKAGSLRDRAMKLNVSVNDLRRGITESTPVLPNGTQVNGLVITKAYFDEAKNSLEPKYLLQCPKCRNFFGIAQKRVQTIFHRCS
jgi:hypothetical protein